MPQIPSSFFFHPVLKMTRKTVKIDANSFGFAILELWMVVKDEKVVGKTTETSVTLKKKESKTCLRVGWNFTRAVGTIQNKNQRIKMRIK